MKMTESAVRTDRKERFRRFMEALKNKDGSEALEMVYSTFMMSILILSAMLILAYAIQFNALNYATKRVARSVEVSGIANTSQLNGLMRNMLGNANKIGASVRVEPDSGFLYGGRIQLRHTFTVVSTAYYVVNLANPADGDPLAFRIPMTCRIKGMSEVYWKP